MKDESMKMVEALLKNCELNKKNADGFWERELWITMEDGLKHIKSTEEATHE